MLDHNKHVASHNVLGEQNIFWDGQRTNWGLAGAVLRCYVHAWLAHKTRKLSYRKDDRAMRPIHGYPGNFRESGLAHYLLFPKFVMGVAAFVPIDTKNVSTKL